MTISLALDDLFQAELRSEPERELWQPYRTDEMRIDATRNVPVDELLARPEELALEAVHELLGGFGLTVGRQVMADYQQGLLRRGRG